MNEYGPVPVSRLKDESQRIFAALADDRRVLLSRRGVVFCVIEPASNRTFDGLLAAFARSGPGEYGELSASDISQGSPSQILNTVFDTGVPALATRHSQVAGVVLRAADVDLGAAPEREWIEQQLIEWERTHPDASSEEFEAFSDSLAERAQGAQPYSTLFASIARSRHLERTMAWGPLDPPSIDRSSAEPPVQARPIELPSDAWSGWWSPPTPASSHHYDSCMVVHAHIAGLGLQFVTRHGGEQAAALDELLESFRSLSSHDHRCQLTLVPLLTRIGFEVAATNAEATETISELLLGLTE